MKYCRKCDYCEKGMNEGYIINDIEYYCSNRCLYPNYSPQEYNELYLKDLAYWTEWNVRTDAEYKLVNGKLEEL